MSYEFKQSDVLDFSVTQNAETHEKGNELFFKYCPYCEGGSSRDKDTFSVNLKTGAFKCFRSSCGKQGHFVELARDFGFGLDFGNTKKQYRRLPQRKPTSSDKAVDYMAKRGIGPEVVNRYRITTQRDNPKNLVFPFYDENDILVAAKYRKTDFKKGKDKCKEWFEKDTKPILFGMAQCVDFERLIITEGQIDSLSVAECGFNNAVSVPTGAMGFTWLNLCFDWVSRFREVIVFGDLENGKMSLISELQKRLPQKVKAVRFEDYLGEKDANDILCKYGKGAIKKCIENAEVQKIKSVKKISEVKSVDLATLPKIKTNIREIDKVIGGLVFGQIVLLSGKRGQGKSTFMSQLICEALDQDISVFAYSGELPDFHFKSWLDFQLAGKENITQETNEYGVPIYHIDPVAIERINTWYDERAFIYDNSYIPDDNEMQGLTDVIEEVIRQYGTKLICIDNLMTAMDTVNDQNNLYLAQSNFVGRLKKIAIKYDVCVVLVAHPRKNNAEFGNDDVSGSSDITNKVDVVMSYQRVDNEEFNGKLLITKNRLNGRCATGNNAIKLYYSEATKRISSVFSSTKHYSWEYRSESYDDIEEIF